MKEEAERLKKTIQHNKETYSWKLQECETEKCKENLVKQFLKHDFRVFDLILPNLHCCLHTIACTIFQSPDVLYLKLLLDMTVLILKTLIP